MIVGDRPTVVAGRIEGRPVELLIRDGRIVAVSASPGAPDRHLRPGLIDLQVNGYRNHDVNADDLTVEELHALASALFERGTTGFVPTIITAAQEKIVHLLSVIAAARRADAVLGAAILGVHVEGPYLSEDVGARGAHSLAELRDPSLQELEEWLAASDGLIRFVTLAPERRGALPYIRAARAAGITVSIGHSAAEPETVAAAVDAGASMSTHLGNGAPGMLPRHPNLLWAQLAENRLMMGVIADGHHLSPETLTAFVRAKGTARTILVSDSAALAGSPPGRYRSPVGGTVEVTATGRLELPGSGLLAGSGACLAQCVDWATRVLPFPARTILKMATVTPARLVGQLDRGRLQPGARADLVIIDDDRFITIVGGEVVAVTTGLTN